MIGKIVDPNLAAKAYANALSGKPTTVGGVGNVSGSGKADESGDAGGVTFSSFLKTKADQSLQTLRSGEEMSAKAITGEADINDVVAAVTDAEVTLQTVVALRDRMVGAYQEIMRMQM